LVLPLQLALFWFARRYLLIAVSLLVLMSSGLNVMLMLSMPALVFYFPFTRFWQIGVGALLVLLQPTLMVPSRQIANVLLMDGIACILAAGFLLSRNT